MTNSKKDLIESIILATLVFIVIQTAIQNFKVEGSSMDPTLSHGQYVIVDKVSYFRLNTDRFSRIIPVWKSHKSRSQFALDPPKRGEIIVFSYPLNPDRDFVKRVIGIPGDTIEITNGEVTVNGKLIKENYINSLTPKGDLWFADGFRPEITTLQDQQYFVLGDNRLGSNDSRNWGPVPEDNIHGRVWLSYWPLNRFAVIQ